MKIARILKLSVTLILYLLLSSVMHLWISMQRTFLPRPRTHLVPQETRYLLAKLLQKHLLLFPDAVSTENLWDHLKIVSEASFSRIFVKEEPSLID